MADGIFGGVDLSALDDDTLAQLAAVMRERIKTAEADGYDKGASDVHDECLNQRDRIGGSPQYAGRRRGLEQAAQIASALMDQPVRPRERRDG